MGVKTVKLPLGGCEVSVEELGDGRVRICVEFSPLREGEESVFVESKKAEGPADLEGPSVEELAFESGGVIRYP